MKTVFLLFDSLNRAALNCYGGTRIETPNFTRLANRSVRFDNHYVGSMPCMPARRDMHTGRLNFQHRSWGPLEPFDTSFVKMLDQSGTHAHLISDHFHYFTEGGSTYHTQYTTWDFVRGQEADAWKAVVQPPLERYRQIYHPSQYVLEDDRYLASMVNRDFLETEADYPLAQCIGRGLDFLSRNRDKDDWFLQLECFDPHEPFVVPERFRKAFPTDYNGPILDWPRYDRVSESEEETAELRANYAALVAMCDEYLGRILDHFDEHDMWKDTVLILSTDHGYLLGEHDWWAKNRMPFYNEIANIPLFIAHPDFAAQAGSRRNALTQTIDLMPTILELFGLDIPDSVEGKSLLPLLGQDGPHHEAVMYGIFGGATNVTDGRYSYFRYPENVFDQEIFEYTLMPTHQRSHFTREALMQSKLCDGFAFAGGMPMLRIPARKAADGRVAGQGLIEDTTTVLYDLACDPGQNSPLDDPDIIAKMEQHLSRLLLRNEAPPEAWRRLGLAS
ncbi:sulfatase [Paracoccus seriniphilus]|uniref:Arylsulfatase A n=1 Tax=Paracoccus seriniphilus TaxID=184748 RepID=A0A239Q2D1_9RHOB|nr:sulfatase [Paracoccus seriniphilus]WCR15969.1 sulfatase [Paracoccus seriniphilus]SNT76664.1 Arylsulfatase A [Paracoccus seriniphilus]